MELLSLKNKYALDKPIHKNDFIEYCPKSLATINNTTSNFSISLPREDASICLQNSYISLDFEVVKNDDTRYVDNGQIALVNFGPVAFSGTKLTTSSGKHLEKVDILHIIGIMHKLLTSQQQTSKVMYGFEYSVKSEDQN